MNFKLEVIIIPISDVGRAKKFYENLGWRLDADFANGDFRVVQLTPRNSDASIIFGRGSRRPSRAGQTTWCSRSTTSTPRALT
jgi:predicted enzyme related to lactoylglutathione lyase